MFKPRKDSPEPRVSVQGLGKVYHLYRRPMDRLWQMLRPGEGARSEVFIALQNINFSLQAGEVMGIIGVNGAGKSTLLQLISGALTPSTGEVRTSGRIAALLELGAGFNPDFSGRENIYLQAATLGLSKQETDERLQSIIEFAGIGRYIDQPVKTYSSGMQVRLGFSIATSIDPDVLIIDEALSVGDGAFRRKSFDRIMAIKEKGATILFCSHVIFHIEALCDRVLWLHRGRAQSLGSLSQVLPRYQEFIDAYTIDAEASPDDPYSQTTHQSVSVPSPGSAQIESVRFSIDGHESAALKGISQRSTLEAEISFSSDPGLPPPSVALVISSESGKIVASTISTSTEVRFQRDGLGMGSARVQLERIPLNRGIYRLGIYLFCERGIHGYDMRDPITLLRLEHDGLEQGTTLLDARWSDAQTLDSA